MTDEGFQIRTTEAKTVIDATTYLEAEINGYDVIIKEDDYGTRISIYPRDFNRVRLGIIECCPRDVADVEKFAIDAPALFHAIANGLRRTGRIDLRGQQQRRMDEIDDMFRRKPKQASSERP